MAGQVKPLPGLAESAEGLREVVPYGRGEIYAYPTTGLGDIIVGEGDVPERFTEANFLAYRNETVHPRYGDRLIVRRLDKIPFGLVKYAQPHIEDITTRGFRPGDNFRTNHLALRIDGEVPELPAAPQVGVVDLEGVVQFWSGIMSQLKADYATPESVAA